ncbi:NAD(P)H-binding protein [Streptomyces sp. JV176]|uniref:SDR family oxidoreductase n=1 Tax=Streptomyces sp. JV176 TaxID=858630 RepID=UPI002E79C4B0|nr:NAD(P)H-binding protein [Streptomyces sp. JV176]MEE1798957.1 NAD(P)H-binding protein [Streptomyces sp. JV176]
MQILVIGATGYAGRRVSAALARAGHTVLGLARDASAPAARALTVDEVIPVEGDFSEPETWRGHLDGTDVVVHLLMDMSDPVGGDRRLFAEPLAAQERDGRRRLVFTTGISSYGRTGLPLMDENTPGNPESPIGFRFVLEKELAASGLAHTVVRPGFMNGGPATTSMTGQWFAAAEAGDMMQMAADQDELVSSAKAHRLLGWTPRHTSFTDDPTRHYRAWKAAQPAA